MSYSLDYRNRVMKIKNDKNLTFESTSKRFGIGIRTLFRWQIDIEPKKTRNKPATKINMDNLKSDIDKNPDSYLAERATRFGVSISGIFYALQRLKITYKKNSVSPKSR
jgi:transposase